MAGLIATPFGHTALVKRYRAKRARRRRLRKNTSQIWCDRKHAAQSDRRSTRSRGRHAPCVSRDAHIEALLLIGEIRSCSIACRLLRGVCVDFLISHELKRTAFDLIASTDGIGYLACALVLLTFCMQAMVPLRLVALLSNAAFICYGCGRQEGTRLTAGRKPKPLCRRVDRTGLNPGRVVGEKSWAISPRRRMIRSASCSCSGPPRMDARPHSSNPGPSVFAKEQGWLRGDGLSPTPSSSSGKLRVLMPPQAFATPGAQIAAGGRGIRENRKARLVGCWNGQRGMLWSAGARTGPWWRLSGIMPHT
jgi:hypothetical protein